MVCPDCSADNDAGLKFCGECGARLVVSCPACDTQWSATQKFCGECGAPLRPANTDTRNEGAAAASASAPLAERRTVSIMFVDLVGFTTLSETRDPEEVRELLSHYFELATTTVSRYGGTIEKFIGDAVMAVWGVPSSHGDAAERAV